MNAKLLSELAEESRIALADDKRRDRCVDGKMTFAAEYVFFRAMRQGRIEQKPRAECAVELAALLEMAETKA